MTTSVHETKVDHIFLFYTLTEEQRKLIYDEFNILTNQEYSMIKKVTNRGVTAFQRAKDKGIMNDVIKVIYREANKK